jgi:hypothetical protein
MDRNVEYTQTDPWFKYDVLATRGDSWLKDGVFLTVTFDDGCFSISWLEPRTKTERYILRDVFSETGEARLYRKSWYSPLYFEVGGVEYVVPLVIYIALNELERWVFNE